MLYGMAKMIMSQNAASTDRMPNILKLETIVIAQIETLYDILNFFQITLSSGYIFFTTF